MTKRTRTLLKVSPVALASIMSLPLLGCHSQANPPEHQLTEEEIKQMEKGYQESIAKEKELTTGYGKEMQHVAPNVPTEPISRSHQNKRSLNQQALRQSPTKQ